VDHRSSLAYRRFLLLVQHAGATLAPNELDVLREAADAMLFGDADRDEHRASVAVLARTLVEEERLAPDAAARLERARRRIGTPVAA